MSNLSRFIGVFTRPWRPPIGMVLGPALAAGVPSAVLGTIWIGVGDAGLPILLSCIAWPILLACGWRALPGLLLGWTSAALWCMGYGAGPSGMSAIMWFFLMPVGAGLQAVLFLGCVRRVVPQILESSRTRDFLRFLLVCGPLGSAGGALLVCAAAGTASGLPAPYVIASGAAWWLIDLFAGLVLASVGLGFISRAPRPFIPLAMTAAAGSISLGAAVIFGWFTRDALLIQVAPGLTPMQFNTALGFVAAGAGLLALADMRPSIAQVCGGLLAMGGGLTLAQYVFRVELGLDQLFFDHHITVNTVYPGRMAPNTALCFLLMGASLCQRLYGARGGITSSTLCTIVASMGFITLLSYAAGMDSAYSWADMTPMAVHTAAGFLALGLGGLAREVIQPEGEPRRVSLSPLPTGIALAAASIWVWQAARHDERRRIEQLAHDRAVDIARLIDMEITYHNHALNRMAERWTSEGGSGWDVWSADARAHLRDFRTIAAIARADANSVIRWLEPLESNEDIIGFQLSSHPHGREVLEIVRETGAQASTDVISLSGIGMGFIVFTPLRNQGAFDGYLAWLYRIDRLFEVLSPAAMKYYRFRVFEGEKVVFNSDPARAWTGADRDSFQIESEMRGGAWKLQLAPKQSWLSDERSNLPLLILFSGLFLSAAAALALQLLEAVRGQYRVIEISENRLRHLIECAPTGLITVDRQGRICEVNPEAQRQFGYEAGELAGKPIEVLIPERLGTRHTRERQDYAQAPARRAMGAGRDLVALRRDGREFPVEVALAPFKTADGLQVLALVTDITERDEARRKLESHSRALELINKDLDDFAYVASHDLRAPLTAIGSLVQWLEEDAGALLPESSKRHLDLIQNRVARMGRLLEDLLEYSRAGRAANLVETVDTAEMAPQLADLVRGPGHVSLTTSGLPVFDTVRTPLQQVLRNLISNAIKHHDGEHCRIEVNARENGEFYIFQVIDDGPGIPAQYHSKVFNMFQTLKPRDEIEGSGMGLALVRKLVERYGGAVRVLSTGDRGTTIEFTWPKTISGD